MTPETHRIEVDYPVVARARAAAPQPRTPALPRWEMFVLAAYATFLIHLSFVPFDWVRSRPSVHGERWIIGLQAVKTGLPDTVANLFLYVPIGAIGFHLLRRQGSSRARAALLAAMGSMSFSLAIEFGQRWFPSRVPSWADVCSNMAGAIGGIGLLWFGDGALRNRALRIRDLTARRPGWAACLAYILFVLAVQLRPFDLVVDPHRSAAAALRQAEPPLSARWLALAGLATDHHPRNPAAAAAELARLRWEYGLDRLVDVTLYAMLAALWIVGRWSRGGRLQYWSAGVACIGLSAFITGTRVFLISYGLDTVQLICGFVGWPIGCLFGRAWIGRTHPAGLENQQARLGPLPIAWQRGLAVAGIAFVVLYETVPLEFRATRWSKLLDGTDVCLIPFAAHLQSRINQALYDLSGDFLRYAVFGASLSILFKGKKQASRGVAGYVIVAVATAGIMEFLHLWVPSRFSDVTTLIMAAAGSYVGIIGLQRVRDLYREATTVVAEDLLTSQLIEGKSYEPLPARPTGQPHAGTSLSGPARFDPPR